MKELETMSNDEILNNAEEAPQNEALGQDGDKSESIENGDVDSQVDGTTDVSNDESVESSGDTVQEESPPQPTQDQLIKAVKRAKKQGFDKGQYAAQQQFATNQSQALPPNADPNKVFDSGTNTYIDRNMTIGQYESYVISLSNPNQNGGTMNAQQPVQNVTQPNQGQSSNVAQSDPFTESARSQLEDGLSIIGDEFHDFLANSGATPEMANIAGRSKDGIKMLYDLYKSNPAELFKMSRQNVEEQQYQVRRLLEAQAEKAKKKLITKAIPQPEPLKAAARTQSPNMTLKERKAGMGYNTE